jgi:hypothetical protein
MSRRSYLQRIAQPAAPGDTVLFATPRAAPDEMRPQRAGGEPPASTSPHPAADRAVAPPTSPPRHAPTAAIARAAQPETQAPRPASAEPVRAGAVRPLAGAPDRTIRRKSAAAKGAAAPRPHAEPKIFLHAPILSTDVPGRNAAAIAPQPETASTFAAAVNAPEPDSPPIPPIAARAAPLHESAFEPLRSDEPTVPPIHATAPPTAGPSAPPAPGRSAPSAPSASAPTRIHIGTIEVRSPPAPAPIPPPAAPVAASAAAHALGGAAAPVARGYGWRFGLSQG